MMFGHVIRPANNLRGVHSAVFQSSLVPAEACIISMHCPVCIAE